ncbi:hypothetical protein D3C73_1099490 [compost metagenome]
MAMARTRPILSATKDHGSTVTARPTVAREMLRAASAAVIRRSAAMSGSTACVEYSWAKVATPASARAARTRL